MDSERKGYLLPWTEELVARILVETALPPSDVVVQEAVPVSWPEIEEDPEEMIREHIIAELFPRDGNILRVEKYTPDAIYSAIATIIAERAEILASIPEKSACETLEILRGTSPESLLEVAEKKFNLYQKRDAQIRKLNYIKASNIIAQEANYWSQVRSLLRDTCNYAK